MQIQPYLFFDGRCEEALDFYRRALDARINSLMRIKDAPEAQPPGVHPPGSENKILHASFTIGESTLFASDGHNTGNPVFKGVSLSLAVKNDAEAERTFSALSQDGKVQLPLGKTFFSSRFGMVTDRFGVPWMVIVMP
jgi:PhnB protein